MGVNLATAPAGQARGSGRDQGQQRRDGRWVAQGIKERTEQAPSFISWTFGTYFRGAIVIQRGLLTHSNEAHKITRLHMGDLQLPCSNL